MTFQSQREAGRCFAPSPNPNFSPMTGGIKPPRGKRSKPFNPANAGRMRRLVPAGALHRKWGITRSAEDAFLHLLQESIRLQEPQEWSLRHWERNSFVPKSTIHDALPRLIETGLVSNAMTGFTLGQQGMELFATVLEKTTSKAQDRDEEAPAPSPLQEPKEEHQEEVSSLQAQGNECPGTGQALQLGENPVPSERGYAPPKPPTAVLPPSAPEQRLGGMAALHGLGKKLFGDKAPELLEELQAEGAQVAGLLSALRQTWLKPKDVSRLLVDFRLVSKEREISNPGGYLVTALRSPEVGKGLFRAARDLRRGRKARERDVPKPRTTRRLRRWDAIFGPAPEGADRAAVMAYHESCKAQLFAMGQEIADATPPAALQTVHAAARERVEAVCPRADSYFPRLLQTEILRGLLALRGLDNLLSPEA